MKRTLSIFLAAALIAVLLAVPALADTTPWVQVDGRGTSSQTISVHGLSGNYHGIQLTLNLDKTVDEFLFHESVLGDGDYATYRQDGTSVTLYATSRGPLNQGEVIQLGMLQNDESFIISSVSGLKLLSISPDTVEEISYGSVGVGSPDSGQGNGASTGTGTSIGSGVLGDGSAPVYSVGTASGIGNGSIQISGTHARRGETVTVTAVPNEGYMLASFSVIDSAGGKVLVTDLGSGTYSFVMPALAVTINASFVEISSQEQDTVPVSLPFADVKETDWFREAVAYVYGAGLMKGTGEAAFSPGGTTTRGMIVTILYRLEDAPTAGTSNFPDVAEGQYYTDAIAWASANGIVNGYDTGLFGPNRTITREQMAAILYRYAGYKGFDISAKADLSAFVDAEQISSYAREAMAWANGTGLITGVDEHTLNPGGSATRAQVATILMRFCENIAKQA